MFCYKVTQKLGRKLGVCLTSKVLECDLRERARDVHMGEGRVWRRVFAGIMTILITNDYDLTALVSK